MVHLPVQFEIDHLGIAVNSLSEGELPYLAMGLTAEGTEEVPREKVRVRMFELKNNARIELLEPTSPDSTIAKFLAKRGPGLHHICLRVSNIAAVLEQLKAKGIRLIHETPFAGAHNCMVAFVHPSSMGGVLVELSEKMAAQTSQREG